MNRNRIYKATFNATKAVLDVSDFVGMAVVGSIDASVQCAKDLRDGVRDAVYDKQAQIINGVIINRS